jgi:lipid II:glycine glycyltransferase (peptidoglycan interpeptide bridge formation enzyme)
MVFLIHGWAASYYLGWASALARKVFAHGPILWQAALALRGKGVRMLDLGEVNTDTGAGLARFKLGTGARVVAAGPSCLVLPGGR